MTLRNQATAQEELELKSSAWIPEEFAVVGKHLKLQQYGEWVNGWLVVATGNKRGFEECMERKNDYRKQRKASDI